MRTLKLLLLFLFPFSTYAQVVDDFSDGDFTSNPAWSGDVSKWQVVTGQLNSNSAIVNDAFYLSTSSTIATNAQWDLSMLLDFSTSSANYVDVFLISDQSDLNNSLNGYFVRVGGTPDEISLYRKDGATSTIIINGVDGRAQPASSSNSFKLRVKRTASNDWTVEDDNTGTGTNYFLEGTISDATYLTSNFFGFSVKQSTASFFNKHFFDNINVGNIVVDVTSPTILSSTAVSAYQLDVKFSEPITQATAEDETNYLLNGSGNPVLALRDVSDFSLVHLTFGANFTSGALNTLAINNISDISSNSIAANSTTTFTYNAPVTAAAYDVVINEIYFEPSSASQIPNVEFVEIFNRSNNAINLTGWTLNDGTTSIATIGNVTLLPDSFLIVCASSNALQFTFYGNVFGTPSFPSLNNDVGDDLKLLDNIANKIDEVIFSDAYYHDNNKSTGGWTIERIDADFTCDNLNNWKASVDVSGGTPGKVNSVKGTYTDTTSPEALRAYVPMLNTVQIIFSETPDVAAAGNVLSYTIDNSIGNPQSVSINNEIVTLTLAANFQPGIIYTVTLSDNIKDCPGNFLTGTKTLRFALAEQIAKGDLIINEILFNPKPNGYDFVELYNNSQKVLDLKQIRIANTDDADSIATQYIIAPNGYLIFPGDYLLLTENKSSVVAQYPNSVEKAFLETSLPSFNDDAGSVVVTDFAFNRIDQFNYTADYQYPLIENSYGVEGVSLERINFNRDTQDKTNWHSAAALVGYATPGYKNSQYNDGANDGSDLTISPEVFSPDNDGFNDVVSFILNLNANGYTLNAEIYNEDGRVIKKLARNRLLAPADIISWDGINERNEKAAVGIYIFYASAFNTTGDVKKFKKAFVLASKL